MKNTSVRLALASLVAVLSVLGLGQAPAGAEGADRATNNARTGWCCS
jgi:hypothetical protein